MPWFSSLLQSPAGSSFAPDGQQQPPDHCSSGLLPLNSALCSFPEPSLWNKIWLSVVHMLRTLQWLPDIYRAKPEVLSMALQFMAGLSLHHLPTLPKLAWSFQNSRQLVVSSMPLCLESSPPGLPPDLRADLLLRFSLCVLLSYTVLQAVSWSPPPARIRGGLMRLRLYTFVQTSSIFC